MSKLLPFLFLIPFFSFANDYIYVPFSAGSSAVQKIKITPAQNVSGDYSLCLGISCATKISGDVSNSQLQTKIRTITGLQSADVTGASSTDFSISMSGTVGPLQNLEVKDNQLFLSETQSLNFSDVPIFGKYAVKYGGLISSLISFDASAATIKSVIEQIPSLKVGSVSGDATLQAAWVRLDQRSPLLLEVVQNSLMTDFQIQKVEFSNTPDAGEFKLEWNKKTSAGISWDASEAQVQSVLRGIEMLGSVVVSGDVSDSEFEVDMIGVWNQSLFKVAENTLQVVDQQEISFSDPLIGGAYQLSYFNEHTSLIPASAGSSDVQAALREISNLENVVVSGESSTDFTVKFFGIRGPAYLLDVFSNSTSADITVTSLVSGDATSISISQIASGEFVSSDTTVLIPGVAPSVDVTTTTPGLPSTLPNSSDWTEIVPSISFGLFSLSAWQSSDQTLILGRGLKGKEESCALIFPNANDQKINCRISNKDRVVIKSVGSVSTDGSPALLLNFDKAGGQ